jgi:myosin heavy subunit
MTDTIEALPEGGDDAAYEAEVEAARLADQQAEPEAPASADPPAETKEEPKAEEKPPLPPEELKKRAEQKAQALRQERQARRDAEKRAQELERQFNELKQRLTPQPQRPDPDTQPVEYLKFLDQHLTRAEQAQAQQAQQAQVEAQQQAQVNDIVTRMAEAEDDFRETNPDYNDAINHLKQHRAQELMLTGLTEQEAQAALAQDFLYVVQNAISRGKDPAEVAYSMAKARGWGSNQLQEKAQAKIETIARGQKAAQSLSAAGGRGNSELDVADVANLSGAAFDEAFEKLKARAQRLGL